MPSLYTIELRTAQWETMIEWYRTALGLRVVARVVEDRFALLVAGDATSNEICRVALLGRDGQIAPAGRVSFSYEVVDLAAAAEQLAASSQEFTQPHTNREGFHELVTHDPDGNQVRLFQWPR